MEEPITILTKARDTLIATALQYKKDRIEEKGSLSAYDLNALSNAFKSAGQLESIRYREEKGLDIKVDQSGELELSQADKDRLDDIAVLLAGGKPKKRGRGAGKSGNNKA